MGVKCWQKIFHIIDKKKIQTTSAKMNPNATFFSFGFFVVIFGI